MTTRHALMSPASGMLAAVAVLAAGCGGGTLQPGGASSGLGNISGAGTGAGGAVTGGGGAGAAVSGGGGAGASSAVTGGGGAGAGSAVTGGGGAGAGTAFTPKREVDMLFVIDSSSSAGPLQANLLYNFPAMISALSASAGGLPSLQLAVITADMGAGDGSIAGCSAGEGDAGLFRWSANTPCAATLMSPDTTFIWNLDSTANYKGTLSDAFACLAAVGTKGCSFQQPLAAIARALGADGRRLPDESRGFLRPDAFLYVAIVTGEDDCSVPAGSVLFDTKVNATLDSMLGPPTHYRCNEFGHLCGGAPPPRARRQRERRRHAARPLHLRRGLRLSDPGGDLHRAAPIAQALSRSADHRRDDQRRAHALHDPLAQSCDGRFRPLAGDLAFLHRRGRQRRRSRDTPRAVGEELRRQRRARQRLRFQLRAVAELARPAAAAAVAAAEPAVIRPAGRDCRCGRPRGAR
jgi:hypothetical protein